MFDIGFSELVLIGVIALIVIGPERLPEVARTVGKYVGRMRRFVNKVRNDIENEVNQEEIRAALKKHADLDDIKKIISDSRYTIENEVEETRQHVVKATEEDPRGDFSQHDLIHEQDEEFENEDYGLTDHRDHGADEETTESAPTQVESSAKAESKAQTKKKTKKKSIAKKKRTRTKASDVDSSGQDDGHNEKPEN